MRRVGVREIPDIVFFPGQVGYPTSMNTDAGQGSSVTGYEKSQMAFESCGASRSSLVRLMGQDSQGRKKN